MVDSTPLISENSNKNRKQGHRVLCCCDSRKATIFLSLVALVLSIMALVGAVMPNEGVPENAWSIATFSISIFFYLLVIWGAIRYHRCAVIVSIIWEIAALVMIIIGTVQYDWSSVSSSEKQSGAIALAILMAWRLLVIYAEGTFVYEVNKGIMSHETHSREKYSCCCNV